MRLFDLVEAYIGHKRSIGMRFISDAAVLRSYCRAMGDVAVEEVRPESALAFIAGTGAVTTRWGLKFCILRSFYRYAINRGFALQSPLPIQAPNLPPTLTPYIYSVDDLNRLVAATEALKSSQSRVSAETMRNLLLLLYGTGMRIGEALSLTLEDVNLKECLLTVRDTKFFKTRIVPIGPRLTLALINYVNCRRQFPLPSAKLRRSLLRAPVFTCNTETCTTCFADCARWQILSAKALHATSLVSTTSGTPPSYIGLSRGIAPEPTCNACCHSWQLISAMSI
jgi:integrase/recombinase XerD